LPTKVQQRITKRSLRWVRSPGLRDDADEIGG
jgi:hypothetical protein